MHLCTTSGSVKTPVYFLIPESQKLSQRRKVVSRSPESELEAEAARSRLVNLGVWEGRTERSTKGVSPILNTY